MVDITYLRRGLLLGLGLLVLLPMAAHAAEPSPPRILLFIGDGMGAAHREAAQWYAVGREGALAMDVMPFRGAMSTTNVYGEITDSAAAGTALATGVKSYNGAISVDVDGTPLTTILEQAQDLGLAVGLATNTQMSHATPAVFAAHVDDRGKMREIAGQMLEARVNVLLGGGRRYFEPDLIPQAVDAGYAYVDDAAGLNAIDPTTTTHLLGLFAADGMPRPFSPTLASMTQSAIDVLAQDPDGFFLVVEGGQIDWASHGNDAAHAISDTVGFDAAVAVGQAYAAEAENVLVIVTADHETGGMSLSQEATGAPDEDGPFPIAGGGEFYVNWSSTKHTTATVPTTAQGPWSARIEGGYENTHVYEVMRTVLFNPLVLSIRGSTTGTVLAPETFIAAVAPVTATTPFIYHWTATEAPPVTYTGGISHTVAFHWTHPGTKTVTVTAQSAEIHLRARHHLVIKGSHLYLPLILATPLASP